MDSINSFIHLLDKIETQDRRLGMTIKNLRCLTGGKSMELAYAMALKLAEESEKLTLLTRALPAYTGNPRALQDVDAVAAESVPIEAGFTIEGWFCIQLPLLLPKKERAPPPIFGASCTRRSETSFRAKHRFDTPKAS